MKKLLTGLIALLVGVALAAPVAWSADKLAQSTDKPGQTQDKSGTPTMEKAQPGEAKQPAGATQPGEARQIEGKIQKVSGNTVTLGDGTQLTIPSGVQVARKDLKPGTNVRASYEEKGGHKMVISLEVEPAR